MKQKILIIFMSMILVISIGKTAQGFDPQFSAEAGSGSVIISGQFTSDGSNHWSYQAEFIPYLKGIVNYNQNLKLRGTIIKSTHQPQDSYYNGDGDEFKVTGGQLEMLQITGDVRYNLPLKKWKQLADYDFLHREDIDYYVLGGLGIYRWSCDIQYELSTGGIKEAQEISQGIDLGLNLGSGVEYRIADRFRLITEGNYHLLFTDNYNTGLFTLTTGLQYQF